MMSSAAVPAENFPGIVKAIPGSGENRSPSRRNRCSPSARNPVRLRAGTLFTFAPESFSPSPGIRIQLGAADLPVTEFLRGKKMAARDNPGSFSLVGYVYPDKKRIGIGLTGRDQTCFPGISFGDQQSLAAEVSGVYYSERELSFLFKFVKPGTATDSIEADLKSSGVRFATIRARGLVQISAEGAALRQLIDKGACAAEVRVKRHFVVSDAIGVTELSYEFFDERRQSVSAKIPLPVISSLFDAGLSGSRTAIGFVKFDKPTFVGFALFQWDGSNFKVVRVGN